VLKLSDLLLDYWSVPVVLFSSKGFLIEKNSSASSLNLNDTFSSKIFPMLEPLPLVGSVRRLLALALLGTSEASSSVACWVEVKKLCEEGLFMAIFSMLNREEELEEHRLQTVKTLAPKLYHQIANLVTIAQGYGFVIKSSADLTSLNLPHILTGIKDSYDRVDLLCRSQLSLLRQPHSAKNIDLRDAIKAAREIAIGAYAPDFNVNLAFATYKEQSFTVINGSWQDLLLGFLEIFTFFSEKGLNDLTVDLKVTDYSETNECWITFQSNLDCKLCELIDLVGLHPRLHLANQLFGSNVAFVDNSLALCFSSSKQFQT
jgi:hypothetical protein